MKQRNILCVFLACLFTLYVLPMAAYADEGKTVRVAMLEYPNYISTGDDGEPYGYACEYLDEIANYTGWTYEYVPVTFSEALEMLEKGEIDIVPGSQYTPERAEKYDYSDLAMGVGGTVICVPADCDKYAYNDFTGFSDMKIAALQGSARIQQTKDIFAENGVSADIIPYPTDADAKKAVADGEADALLMSSIRCEENYKIIADISYTPLYFTVNPHDRSIKNGIDYAQQQIHFYSPYYENELNEKYYGSVMSGVVFTAAERQYIEEHPTVAVAYADGRFPFTTAYDGEPAGIAVEVLDAVSQICGIEFTFENADENEKISDCLKRTGCSIYAGVTERRVSVSAPELQVSDVYYSSYETLFSAKNEMITSDSTGVVAVARTYSGSESALAELFPNVTFRYYNTSAEVFTAVASGEADYAAENILMADYLRQKPAFSDMTEASSSRVRQAFVYAFSQDTDPRLISIINKSLARISSDDISHIVSSFVSEHRYEFTLADIIRHNLAAICITAVIIIMVVALVFLWGAYREKNRRRLSAMNAKLEEAVADANRATKLKNAFITRMNCSILAPLNEITELSAEAESFAPDNDRLTDHMHSIRERSEIMLELVSAYLNYSDAEEGNIRFSREPVEIRPFMREISSAVFDTVRAKNIGFAVNTRGFTCKSIYCDRKYTKYIFTTLIKCAARFTPKGGKISLEFEQTADYGSKIQITAAISDNGTGMTAEEQLHAFSPMDDHERGSELSRDITELELAAVKAIVEQTGGVLSVESRKNGGTRITITADYDKYADIVGDYAEDINIAPKVKK
ncbi:MAG: transporter substrate-binding domain-containing protein [Oscillospiraceae bacterium]